MPVATAAVNMPADLTKVRRESSTSVGGVECSGRASSIWSSMSLQGAELMAGLNLVDGAKGKSYDEQVYVDEGVPEKDAWKK